MGTASLLQRFVWARASRGPQNLNDCLHYGIQWMALPPDATGLWDAVAAH